MKPLLTLVLLVSLLGCEDSKKKEIRLLGDKVIELHDEAMPLMDGLYKTRVELQGITIPDSLGNPIPKYSEAIVDIKNAEDTMMKWMQNFDPNYKGVDDAETLQYLQSKKETMEQVFAQMNHALTNGQAILSKR